MYFANRTALIATLILASTTTHADDRTESTWSSFRNGGNSTVSGILPESWSPDRGVKWQLETDGYGQSAPVIFDGTIYLTSTIGPMKEICAVTALNVHTGRVLWQDRQKASENGPSNYMYSRAAPSPVVDSLGIFAFFESGDLIAVKNTGVRMWHRNLAAESGPFQTRHGLGSSLAQSDELLILNLEHKGPSRLIAIRKSDGYIAWQVDRPSGSSWTSPIVTKDAVIVSSAGSVAAYTLDDGTLKWTIDGLEGNSVPSPCIANDRLFIGARVPEFGSASDAAKSNLCVKLMGDSAEVAWRAEGAVCDYASPIVDQDRVYFLNKVGVLSCLNAHTGKTHYRTRLGAECWATPVVAENGIYFFAKNGVTRMIARTSDFQLLATNQLWDPDNAPTPETYREAAGAGHGHGSRPHRHSGHEAHHGKAETGKAGHGKADHGKTETGKAEANPTQGGRGGMFAALMKQDTNQDGILQEQELSADFRPMLKRVDTNGDGALDKSELEAMAKSFAERRRNSRSSARDPIVYGVAAIPGTLIIRTGTRLYCVTGASVAPSAEGARP